MNIYAKQKYGKNEGKGKIKKYMVTGDRNSQSLLNITPLSLSLSLSLTHARRTSGSEIPRTYLGNSENTYIGNKNMKTYKGKIEI